MISVNFNIHFSQLMEYLVCNGYPKYDKIEYCETGCGGRDILVIKCKNEDGFEDEVFIEPDDAFKIIVFFYPDIELNKLKQSEDDAFWLLGYKKDYKDYYLIIYFETEQIPEFKSGLLADNIVFVGQKSILIKERGMKLYIDAWMKYFNILNFDIKINIHSSLGVVFFDVKDIDDSLIWGQFHPIGYDNVLHVLTFLSMESYITSIDLNATYRQYVYDKNKIIFFFK